MHGGSYKSSHSPRAITTGDLMRKVNQGTTISPIYNYAFVTDSEEGLIVVNVNTLADGLPRNNFLTRALTWNEGGVLSETRHITMAGHIVYITTPTSLVVLDLNDPLKPKLVKKIEMQDPRATGASISLFVCYRC